MKRNAIRYLVFAAILVLRIRAQTTSAVPADLLSTPINKLPATGSGTRQIAVKAELEEWQKRRFADNRILIAVRGPTANAAAYQALDKLLTDCEKHPLARTPIENLDVIGVFYLPKDGIEKCLPVIVMNCVLGWYDALRFGTESGRAELVNNEHFFGRAIFLGGNTVKNASIKFLSENPQKAHELIEQGLEFAERFRNVTTYDRQWPSAYGLERMMAAMGGKYEAPKPMPEILYDKAWEDAKSKVEKYFQLTK